MAIDPTSPMSYLEQQPLFRTLRLKAQLYFHNHWNEMQSGEEAEILKQIMKISANSEDWDREIQENVLSLGIDRVAAVVAKVLNLEYEPVSEGGAAAKSYSAIGKINPKTAAIIEGTLLKNQRRMSMPLPMPKKGKRDSVKVESGAASATGHSKSAPVSRSESVSQSGPSDLLEQLEEPEFVRNLVMQAISCRYEESFRKQFSKEQRVQIFSLADLYLRLKHLHDFQCRKDSVAEVFPVGVTNWQLLQQTIQELGAYHPDVPDTVPIERELPALFFSPPFDQNESIDDLIKSAVYVKTVCIYLYSQSYPDNEKQALDLLCQAALMQEARSCEFSEALKIVLSHTKGAVLKMVFPQRTRSLRDMFSSQPASIEFGDSVVRSLIDRLTHGQYSNPTVNSSGNCPAGSAQEESIVVPDDDPDLDLSDSEAASSMNDHVIVPELEAEQGVSAVEVKTEDDFNPEQKFETIFSFPYFSHPSLFQLFLQHMNVLVRGNPRANTQVAQLIKAIDRRMQSEPITLKDALKGSLTIKGLERLFNCPNAELNIQSMIRDLQLLMPRNNSNHPILQSEDLFQSSLKVIEIQDLTDPKFSKAYQVLKKVEHLMRTEQPALNFEQAVLLGCNGVVLERIFASKDHAQNRIDLYECLDAVLRQLSVS